MRALTFGAYHTFTLRTHPTIGADRTQRQQLKYDLSALASQHGFAYDQNEYSADDTDFSGKNFVTEITLDTGRNQGETKNGQLVVYQNAGDEVVATFARRLPASVRYESGAFPDEVDFSQTR